MDHLFEFVGLARDNQVTRPASGGVIPHGGEVGHDAIRAAIAQASEVVLAGFRLRSDAKIVRWPDRYMVSRIDNPGPLLYTS